MQRYFVNCYMISALIYLASTGFASVQAQQVQQTQQEPSQVQQPPQSQPQSQGQQGQEQDSSTKAQEAKPEEAQQSKPEAEPGQRTDQQGTDPKAADPKESKEPDPKEAGKGADQDQAAPKYQAVWDKYPVLNCKFFGTYICQDGKCNFEKRTKPSIFHIDFAKNLLSEHTEHEKATINRVSPIVNRIWQKPRVEKEKSKFKKALVKELHDGTFVILDGGEFNLWTLYEEPQKKLYRAFYNSHTLGVSFTGTGVCLPQN